MGLLLGIFPMLGVTTWLMTLLSFRLPLNLPLMLTVSYLVFPLQAALIVPFMRYGEWLFEVEPLGLSFAEIQAAFEADFFAALKEFWDANLYAIGGWLTIALPAGLLLYFVLFQTFRYFIRRRQVLSPASSPAE